MDAISDKIFIPAVRFSEFSDNWKLVRFSKCFKGIKKIPKESDNYPLYSLTIKDGVTPKTERYEREFLVKNVDTAYKIVEKDNFVYNPMNLRFGALAKHNSSYPVAVSKYYDVFSCKDGFLANYFANYLLTNRMIIFYNRMATGSLEEKKRLHFSDFLNFEKPVPSEEEQLKIANFLTSVDTKIQQLKRKHTLMQQYKKGVMQQLFSQQARFKDDYGRRYPDWHVAEFGEIILNKPDKYDPKKMSNDLVCVELDSLAQDGGFLLQTYSTKKLASTKNKFQKGSVLFGKLRPYLKKYWLASFDGACSTEIWVLSGKKVSSEFLYYLIQTHQFQQIANVSSGSKMPRSDWKFVSTYPVKYPNAGEQKKIADILASIDEKIQRLNTQITQAETFKKGLLQQMFV